MNEKIKLSVGLGCIVIILGFMIFSIFNQGFAQWENKSIASFFIDQGWRQLDATNTVTTIVWEYRGYDTLGEETVLFTAAMGVFAIGAGLFAAERIQNSKEKATLSTSVKESVKP